MKTCVHMALPRALHSKILSVELLFFGPSDVFDEKKIGNLTLEGKAVLVRLMEYPAFKKVEFRRAGDISIEVGAAWNKHWDEISPVVTETLNDVVFSGEGTIEVEDERTHRLRQGGCPSDW